MNKHLKKSLIRRVRPKMALAGAMILIGSFTTFASANTYEVITRHDIKYSSVIKDFTLTTNSPTNQHLVAAYDKSFDSGDFGIPQKIKFPETKQHINITRADYEAPQWKASKGLAQTFLIAKPRQKVFGTALIYLRYNTPTTQHLGDVLTDDVINVVTTEGWQLGYQVTQTSDDISRLNLNTQNMESKIIVVMVDDHTGQSKCFQASLSKVGERI